MKTMVVDEARLYLSESLQSLRSHHNQSSGGANKVEFKAELRRRLIDPDTVHFQVWWVDVPSRVANAFIWDAFNVELVTSTDVDKFMEESRNIPNLLISEKEVSRAICRPVTDVPLFRYQPQRFRALVPFAKRLAQLSGSNTMFSSEMAQTISQEFMAGQDMSAILLRPRVEDPDQRGRTLDPINLGIFFCEFNRCGRQIFDMPSALVEMFRHTDVDDITLESLHFPYDAFYLYFGPQLDLETKPGWHPDGAYVTVLGPAKHIQMLLTSSPPNKETYGLWYSYGEPIFVQAMSPEQTKIGVGEAAEMVLADKIKTLKDQLGGKSSVVPDGEIIDGLTVIDATKQNAAAELAALPTKYAAWREMLKLVVNAIAYLSAYPDDIKQQWPTNTPQSLYLQMQDGAPKQKKRAQSKLAALGFTAIHMCGTQFRDKEETVGRVKTQLDRKPTWVRGHWVRQPYGPQHSLRRLQWRMPHLRNSTDADSASEDTGHIYLVS